MLSQTIQDQNTKSSLFVFNKERLSSIVKPDINFAIWQRNISSFLDNWTREINWHKTETLEGEIDIDSLEEFEDDLFSELSKWRKGLPDMTRWIAQDMALNVKLFMQTTSKKRVFIKIEPVSSDMCRLFHVDNNDLRMLCTYVGQGTLWLPNNNANRKFLGKGNNQDIVIEPLNIFQAQKLDVLILKGELYPENKVGGAIHKSPPLKQGERRLLLKIDSR